jgi:opacity protein-like surface antigen
MRRSLRSVLPLVVYVLAVAAPAAHAAAPRFEITPFAGYRTGGEFEAQVEETGERRNVDVEDGGSWGIDLGLYRDPNGIYELLYSKQSTGIDSSDPTLGRIDVDTEYFQFGGTLFFPDENWFIPYLSLTIGATRFDADGGYDSKTRFSGSLGGGVRLPFNDRVAATLGARGYLTFVDSDTDILCISDAEGADCLLRSSGSTYFQAEAQLGFTVVF